MSKEYYCPNCNAILNNQKGFNDGFDSGYCANCGEFLINPKSDDAKLKYKDVRWFCDKCDDYLNAQEGFSDWLNEWKCKKCGYVNKIDAINITTSKKKKYLK